MDQRLSRSTSDDPTGDKLLRKIKAVEPAPDDPTPIMMFESVVKKVYHRVERQCITGIGQEAKFHDVDMGWYIGFQGSYESLYCGPECPDVAIGTKVRIVIYPREKGGK